MSSWSHEFDWDRESLLEFCERDREAVTCDFFLERPGYARKQASVWLEEFLDFCGVLVDDWPLAKGQLGLCDMKQGWIFLNSRMGEFARSPAALKALRVSTLAHELGHLRLHREEDQGNVLVSYYGDAHFHHPRSFQREAEADLYAGVFLLPVESLRSNKSIVYLLQHSDAGIAMRSAYIWKALLEAAATMGVTSTLMKKRLLHLDWIEQLSPWSAGSHAKLKLRMPN